MEDEYLIQMGIVVRIDQKKWLVENAKMKGGISKLIRDLLDKHINETV